MTFNEEQVEWIVAEVIRRLSRSGDERGPSPTSELRVVDRVVTMHSIEGRLFGVTRIVVKSRAVITPAVRDELKQRKIELVEAPT